MWISKGVLCGVHSGDECQLLPVCGGGCLKAWYEGISPCPSLKFNLRERLLLSYLFNVKGYEICAKIAGKSL